MTRRFLSGLPLPYFAPDGGAGGASIDVKQLESMLSELGLKIGKVSEELKRDGETLKTEIKNLGAGTKETTEKVDKALTESTDTRARMAQLEQIIVRIREGGGHEPRKSVGQEVVESDAFKAFAAQKGKGRVSIDVKQMITSAVTDVDGSVGDAIRPDRRPGLIVPAQMRMTIRGLLLPGNTTSNSVEYVREKGFTNAAAIQAKEGDSKPESSIQFELKNATVRTIAHWMQASTQVLEDIPQLQSHIDGRLRYGLQLVEEQQLLAGSGAGVELEGLWTAATDYAPAFTPTALSFIDVLRLAMLQATLAQWPATGHVLNPIDWAKIELTKDGDERYIFANPQQLAGPTLWGLPIVQTQAIREDHFLTGAFAPAAQIFDRQGATVTISTEDRDNFIRNLVTILAEERLTLAIYRPEALIRGEFGGAS